MFFADSFLIHRDNDIANIAKDNTPYPCAKNLEDVIECEKYANDEKERDLIKIVQ